ncbi:hypothetical protein EFP18_11145 [Burkholderia glumae]|nr:hypothetical protein EFP18_11145 [Burkholderia glumae]
MNDSLTTAEAYRAMFLFLERYYERGGCQSEDIATLLSGMSQNLWADGGANDPTQWHDWLAAVKAARENEAG